MFWWNDCGNKKKAKQEEKKKCLGHFSCVEILVSESVHIFVLDWDVSPTIVWITSEVGYRHSSQEMNPRAALALLQQQLINNELY